MLGLIYLIVKRGRRGPTGLRWSLYIALLAGVVFSASMGMGYLEDVRTRRGVVITECQALKGNGENYTPAFNKPLKEGAEFRLLEKRGGWYKVDVPGAGEGWLKEQQAVVY